MHHKTHPEWHVNALEGHYRDYVEADDSRSAVVAALPYILKRVAGWTPGDWVDVDVWQHGDETIENYYFRTPPPDERVELFGDGTSEYDEARAALR